MTMSSLVEQMKDFSSNGTITDLNNDIKQTRRIFDDAFTMILSQVVGVGETLDGVIGSVDEAISNIEMYMDEILQSIDDYTLTELDDSDDLQFRKLLNKSSFGLGTSINHLFAANFAASTNQLTDYSENGQATIALEAILQTVLFVVCNVLQSSSKLLTGLAYEDDGHFANLLDIMSIAASEVSDLEDEVSIQPRPKSFASVAHELDEMADDNEESFSHSITELPSMDVLNIEFEQLRTDINEFMDIKHENSSSLSRISITESLNGIQEQFNTINNDIVELSKIFGTKTMSVRGASIKIINEIQHLVKILKNIALHDSQDDTSIIMNNIKHISDFCDVLMDVVGHIAAQFLLLAMNESLMNFDSLRSTVESTTITAPHTIASVYRLIEQLLGQLNVNVVITQSLVEAEGTNDNLEKKVKAVLSIMESKK